MKVKYKKLIPIYLFFVIGGIAHQICHKNDLQIMSTYIGTLMAVSGVILIIKVMTDGIQRIG